MFTFLVLKLDISNVSKDLQAQNIPSIFFNFGVWKLDKFNDFKAVHPENI